MDTNKQTLRVVVDGQAYQVEISGVLDGALQVAVDGQPYQVEVSRMAVAAAAAGQPAVGSVSSAPAVMPPVEQAAVPVTGSGQISAPMPGVIVEIFVEAGDQVTVGQPLCLLEAMKMKNNIRASFAGQVTSVEVQLGQSVPYGAALFKVE